MALFSELRRRRVLRVAAIYGAVSWIFTEAWSVVQPTLGLPEESLRYVVVLFLAGFPVSMILAWLFDIGPEGITRTAPIERAQREVKSRPRPAADVALKVVGHAKNAGVPLNPTGDRGDPQVPPGALPYALLPTYTRETTG